jgi:2-polyprenyl-6-methoxyphenol hydroxylase-like FAD-dependent oxidoreductase
MKKTSELRRGHALVIGGSMAGLLAARVISEFYENVTLIERDHLSVQAEQRRGVPHGRHAHAILSGGLRVLEELFPGIAGELADAGAVPADAGRDGVWFFEGAPLKRDASSTSSILMTRPLLEHTVRQRVLELPNLCILDAQIARNFETTDDNRVIGVRTDSHVIEADLVIDATGRGSHSGRWLASLGFSAAREETVEVQLVYTTRVFQRRPEHLKGDKFTLVTPTAQGKRGGVILAQEGDKWIVTLFGHFGQAAPADLNGFIEFARSLAAPFIYDVVRDAEPIGEAVTFRFPASSRRRYENLARFPEGFLVFGDAICSFNPIYGQGMSVAALQAKALRQELKRGTRDLARRFFRKAAQVIDNPWNIAVGGDLKMPETTGRRGPGVRLMNWYLSLLHKCAHTDGEAAQAFIRVAQLIDGPSLLLRPRLVGRVFSNRVLSHFGRPANRQHAYMQVTDQRKGRGLTNSS